MKRLSAASIRRPQALAAACGLLAALTALPANAQSCVQPPAGLVSWWPLDETSGTAVADVLGKNPGIASGTIGPMGPPKSAAGFVGNGLNFFFQSRVMVSPSPANPSLNFGTDKSFTIDAWIKGRASPIVSNVVSTKAGYSVFVGNNGKLRFDIGTGSTQLMSWDGPPITPGEWTFVAVVVDRITKKVTLFTAAPPKYNLVFTSGPIPNTADAGINLALNIGGCPGNPNGCDTVIDEVEIFNRPLSQPELQKIVDAGNAGKCKPQPAKGMTWKWVALNATNGTASVGCGSTDPVHPCDPYVGDQLCTDPLPLLCFKPSNFPVPKSVDNTSTYYRWSGGIIATTAPVAPAAAPINSSLASANARCAQEFGAGWRVAEFHDGIGGSGWGFQAYGNVGNQTSRFWLHINDQPKGTCFTKP